MVVVEVSGLFSNTLSWTPVLPVRQIANGFTPVRVANVHPRRSSSIYIIQTFSVTLKVSLLLEIALELLLVLRLQLTFHKTTLCIALFQPSLHLRSTTTIGRRSCLFIVKTCRILQEQSAVLTSLGQLILAD